MHLRNRKLARLTPLGLLLLLLASALLTSLPAPAFGASVNVSIAITTENGPKGVFLLSGCSISPSTIVSDGAAHSFTATNSCVVTITVPRDTAISYYAFAYDTMQGNSEGLNNNQSATFETCASGTCSLRSYTAYYESTTSSSTYALTSWNGGGVGFPTNDSNAQQVYEATGSMSVKSAGYQGCGGGNTTATSLTLAMSSTNANLFGKYQIPFETELPMDGYSGSCGGWATSVVNQHPDMLTYSSTAPACTGRPGSYTCTSSWVRVDDMNLATQIYNDLVATKNLIAGYGSGILPYWDGIQISSISSDGGTGPYDNYGQDTIWHFAKSQYCITNFGSGDCSILAGEVSDIQAAPSSTAYAYLTGPAFGGVGTTSCNKPCYGDYIDSMYLLAATYAAYNFSQKYAVGHPFTVLPGKPSYSCFSSTSLYPYPYNTTYIEGLNLCQYEVVASGTVENGGLPSLSTVSSNQGVCLGSSNSAGIPGQMLVDMVSGSYGGNPASVKTERNMLFYQPLCAATAIEAPGYGGTGHNWAPVPSNTYFWQIQPSFAVVLNRMENVGYHQFPKVSLSRGYGSYPNVTNVTLLGGIGVPLLAWFYTNMTGGATASVSLAASTYHLSSHWCAVSLLTMEVLSCTGGSTINLTVNIPSANYPGWNPVYIFNVTSSLSGVMYSTQRVMGTSINSTAISTVYNGPHTLGAWQIVYDSQAPSSVVSNRTGTLSEYSSMALLNKSLIGETYVGGTWQNETQQGWYYDSTNHLVYVHFQIGSPVEITVDNQVSGASLGADGTAAGCGTAAASFVLNPLSTTSRGDVVIIGTTILGSSTTVSGISDTAGLSWSARSGQVIGGAGAQETDTEEWYALAPSPLSVDVITVTLKASASACSNAVAVKGASLSSLFDTKSGNTYQGASPATASRSGTIGSPTFGGNGGNSQMLHNDGYYIEAYAGGSPTSLTYTTCRDSLDCANPTSWSSPVSLYSFVGYYSGFSMYYQASTNKVFVVYQDHQTIKWAVGTFSAGSITWGSFQTFTPAYGAFGNCNLCTPSLTIDASGHLILAVPTTNAGNAYIETWKCSSASPSCTWRQIDSRLMPTDARYYPVLSAFSNGDIGLTYFNGGALYFTSCPSACSGSGSWSPPVATSNSAYSLNSRQCVSDSNTVYCDPVLSMSGYYVYGVSISDGNSSWSEKPLTSNLGTSGGVPAGIATDGSSRLIATYARTYGFSGRCYYKVSTNFGSSWSAPQSSSCPSPSGIIDAPLQSSDSYALGFTTTPGNSLDFTELTNPFFSTPAVSSVSTTQPTDFVLAFFGYYNSTAQTSGSIGGQPATSDFVGNGGTSPIIASESEVTSAPLSSSSCSFGTPVYNWAVICDAIQGMADLVNTTSTSISSSSTTSSTSSSSSSRSSSSSSSSTSVTTSTSTSKSTSTSSSKTTSSKSTTVTSSSSSSSTKAPGAAALTSQQYTFQIVLSPSIGVVVAGQGIQTAVSVALESGGPHPVGLTASGMPEGTSVSFTPVAGTASFVSVMVINTTSNASPGTYQIDVVGRSGTQVVSSSFALTVEPAAAAPPAYKVVISASSHQGGTIEPAPGTYTYRADQLLTITASPVTGWSFSHWVVNGNPAGNGTQLSFTPQEDVTIVAVFSDTAPLAIPTASVSFAASGVNSTEIVVDGTSYSLPASFAWAVGSTHQVSAQSLIQAGDGTQLVFASWSGGLNTSSPALSLTVEKSMTLFAGYEARYLVDFAFISATGSSVASQNATFYGPDGLITVTSPNASAWLYGGARYTPLGGEVGGTIVPALQGFGSFTVTSPEAVTVPLSAYPVSVRVVDVFGRPISGANVTLTTSSQERLSEITGGNGSATFNNVPMGWFVATYSYLGVSGSLSSSATGAHAETITMALSYPVFTVAAVFAGLIAISAVARWRRGKQVENAFDGYSNF